MSTCAIFTSAVTLAHQLMDVSFRTETAVYVSYLEGKRIAEINIPANGMSTICMQLLILSCET